MTAANSTTDNIASADVLRTLLDTARECVLLVDEDTRIFAVNDAACGVFSKRGEELVHKRLSEVVRDAGLYGAFLLALNEGHASDIRLELIGTGKKKFDVHIAPLLLEGRQLAIGFFYDITKLERLETVRQEFLSNISHELRTPL
ncbi:MAG TPA: PAS domain-containing protein, partial [Pyrinomonadaceae bacterium]|nr:PAS domain-containing protein [Pyrinomonadaceae bacterium]